MLDAGGVINNSSQKVGGSNAYPDPAPKKWVGPDPEKHIGSTLLGPVSERASCCTVVQVDAGTRCVRC